MIDPAEQAAEQLVRLCDQLRDDWKLTWVGFARELPDGHTLTVRLFDGMIEIEREDGEVMVARR